MEDLVSSIDRQNAEDWERPVPACTSPGCGEGQPIELARDLEQSTPPFNQISLAEEASLSSDGSGDDHSDASPPANRMSMDDAIRMRIPGDSDLALSLQQRESILSYHFDGFSFGPMEKLDFERIAVHRSFSTGTGQKAGGVLIIQDINLDWCKALCAQYPKAVHPELLAGHIIRFDEITTTLGDTEAVERDLTMRYPDAGITVMASRSGNFMAVCTMIPQSRRTQKAERFHLDFTVETPCGEARKYVDELDVMVFTEDGDYRQDLFERDDLNKWRRISMSVSCFRLEADLFLILVDSVPELGSLRRGTGMGVAEDNLKVFRIENVSTEFFFVPLKFLSSFRPEFGMLMLDKFRRLFQDHTIQSVFHPRNLPGEILVRVTDEQRMSRAVFAWMLLESTWRASVDALQRQVQILQQEATTIAGDRAFEKLTSLRRQLANAYGLLRETYSQVNSEMKASYVTWHAGEKVLSAEEFWAEERCKSVATNLSRAKSIDLRDLPDLLEELLEKIKTLTRTVNEEIQMVIGSVQVEDARVMRRRTEWTVVLAVLAAIYLPMTLVTGIFGMNISEISAEPKSPGRWSVVKTWGVVFGSTMGSVFVYAMVRYLLRYRHIGRMLLRRRMMKVGDRSMYRRFLLFKNRLQQMWLYQKIRRFREKMREWDVEAQKMEKVE